MSEELDWEKLSKGKLKESGCSTFGDFDNLSGFLSEEGHSPIKNQSFDSDYYKSVQSLMGYKSASFSAGTRVQFKNNVEALLSYPSLPVPGTVGTILNIKSASEMQDGFVFVAWDNGLKIAVHESHLKKSVAPKDSQISRKVANFDDLLKDFKKVSSSELVNKSSKDLWSFRKEADGYVIERLFNDSGEPLKG